MLNESEYLRRAGPDAPKWENIGQGTNDTNTFPHIITGGLQAPGAAFYNALDYSPFSNDVLVSFAEEALVNEQLGQDDDTDVLTVSFSANDYVGHRFGPYSQEVMDITLRVDRQIGTLLDFVNAKVGLANTLVVMTADHGVAPIPEHAATLGLGAARIRSQDVLGVVRAAISAKYNAQNKSPDPTADYMTKYNEGGRLDAFTNGNVYFNYAALRRDGVSLDEIEGVAGQAALTVPGIARYFTRAQLLRGAVSLTDPRTAGPHGFLPNPQWRPCGHRRAYSIWARPSLPRTVHIRTIPTYQCIIMGAGSVPALLRRQRHRPRRTHFVGVACSDPPNGSVGRFLVG